MDQKIPHSLFSFSEADTSNLQRDAVMMQRGAAAGILPPNPGKTANSHVNAPLWFYCLLKTFFLQSDLRVSTFMYKHGEATNECPCFLQEPAGLSKHPGLGTGAAAAPWAPGSLALPPVAIKGSGARGPVTTGMEATLQIAESHRDGSRMHFCASSKASVPYMPSNCLRDSKFCPFSCPGNPFAISTDSHLLKKASVTIIATAENFSFTPVNKCL